MKKISFLLILLLFSLSGYAEILEVQKMEGELRGGISLPVDPYHKSSPAIGYDMAIEGRYNFYRTGWDCGVMTGITSALHHFKEKRPGNIIAQYNQSNLTYIFAATTDYNFYQGRMINPFLGCAVGVGINKTTNHWIYPSSGTSLLFTPRGGVEIYHFFRIMAEFNICRKGYNNFALTVGFVVGGRKKK